MNEKMVNNIKKRFVVSFVLNFMFVSFIFVSFVFAIDIDSNSSVSEILGEDEKGSENYIIELSNNQINSVGIEFNATNSAMSILGDDAKSVDLDTYHSNKIEFFGYLWWILSIIGFVCFILFLFLKYNKK